MVVDSKLPLSLKTKPASIPKAIKRAISVACLETTTLSSAAQRSNSAREEGEGQGRVTHRATLQSL